MLSLDAEPSVLVTAPVKPRKLSVLAAPDVVLAVTMLFAVLEVRLPEALMLTSLELHAVKNGEQLGEVDVGAYVKPGMLNVEMLM